MTMTGVGLSHHLAIANHSVSFAYPAVPSRPLHPTALFCPHLISARSKQREESESPIISCS